MQKLLIALTLVFGVMGGLFTISTPAVAQTAASQAIEKTISDQISAFQADDFASAFTYASPSIQGIFQTPDRFGAMVRNGYPMVWRPADVRFGELREIAGALWQKVIVQDSQGQTHVLDYRMQQIEGEWRISGVQLLPSPDVAA